MSRTRFSRILILCLAALCAAGALCGCAGELPAPSPPSSLPSSSVPSAAPSLSSSSSEVQGQAASTAPAVRPPNDIYARLTAEPERYAVPLRRTKEPHSMRWVRTNMVEFEVDYLKPPVMRNLADPEVQRRVNDLIRREWERTIEALRDRLGEEEQPERLVAGSYRGFNSGNILSILLWAQYRDGSEEEPFHLRSLNIDLNSGDEIRLQDLFVEGYPVDELVRQKITDYRIAHPELSRSPFDGSCQYGLDMDAYCIVLYPETFFRVDSNFFIISSQPFIPCMIPFEELDGVFAADRSFTLPGRSIFEDPTITYGVITPPNRDPRPWETRPLIASGRVDGTEYRIEYIGHELTDDVRDAVLDYREIIESSMQRMTDFNQNVHFGAYVNVDRIGRFRCIEITPTGSYVNRFYLPVLLDENGERHDYRGAIRISDAQLQDRLMRAIEQAEEHNTLAKSLDAMQRMEISKLLIDKLMFRYGSHGIDWFFTMKQGNLDPRYLRLWIPYAELGYDKVIFFDGFEP